MAPPRETTLTVPLSKSTPLYQGLSTCWLRFGRFLRPLRHLRTNACKVGL
jgi:hypothetical protein